MTGYESKKEMARDKLAQEPPQYSFKAYWAEDGRIGVVAAIERLDGGVHLLKDFIDAPQRTWVDLTNEEIGELIIGTLSADTNPAQPRPRDIKFARSVLATFKEKNT